MSKPLVHTPAGLYRPPPLLAGHRGIDPTPPDPFNDNLTHLWKMQEDGTRLDSVGSLDLIKYNSPTKTTGRVGFGTQFPESALSHLYANGSRINPGNNNFEIIYWVKWFRVDDFGDLDLLVEWVNEPTTAGFRLWYNTSSSIYRWSCGGGIPNKTLARVQNNWVMVNVFFNTDDNLSGIAVNNTGFTTAPATGYPNAGGTSHDLVIGAYSTGSVYNDSIVVDSIHVWEDYNLTTDERTYMYNSGFGRELL
jgi:hypothetical protein